MILICVLTTASSAVSAATDTAPGRRNQQIMSAYAGATLLWGYNAWWQDADKTSFHFTNEGWFGADTYRGGADKIGHLYFHYTSQRLLDGAFRWAGNDRRTAARLAAQVVGVTSVLIEITDGFTEEYGFSYEDLLMDFAGIGIGYLVDKHPALDDKLDFRLFYRRSRDARRQGLRDASLDYSGQIYLFAVKLSGFAQFNANPVLRYLEISAGYGTTGYRPERDPQDRSRNLYYGVSLNLAQLLDDTLFSGRLANSRSRKFSHTGLEYLQIPGSAALAGEDL